jgi:hypothetical protein
MPTSGIRDELKVSAEPRPSGKVKFEIYGEERLNSSIELGYIGD